MKIKIISFLLIVVCLFAFALVPCSAYIDYNYFDYTTSYYSAVPSDVTYLRNGTDGFSQSYVYSTYQNILASDYDVLQDSNIEYLLAPSNVEYTPFEQYNPYFTYSVYYLRMVRRGGTPFGMTVDFIPGYLPSYKSLYLGINPIVIDKPSAVPSLTITGFIGYRYYSLADGEYIFDQLVINDTITSNNHYTFNNLYDVHSFNLIRYYEDLFPSNTEEIYIYSLNYSIDIDYVGCGVVQYLGENGYYNPYYDIFSDIAGVMPDQNMSKYFRDFAVSFRNLFSIEILPSLTIFNILSLALCIPVGLAVIKRF